MRFIVERDALADGVMWVSRSLSARPIMPVLLGVLIKADNAQVSGVTVKGANGEGIFILAQLGQNFHSVKIDNVSAINNRNGIYLIADTAAQVDNFIVTNSLASNNSSIGVNLLLNNGAKVTYSYIGNMIANTNGSSGISIQGLNKNGSWNIFVD